MQPRFITITALACLAIAGCSTVQPRPLPTSPWVYQTPKPHGAIYRFFHPKNERMWKGVSPALREKVEAIQAQLAAEGYDVRPVEGYRSPERQAVLLASASGVTSVGAFASCHNFGYALDAAVFVNGEPSWNLDDNHVLAGYQRFGELAEILGLNWGGRWTTPKDYPHVELKAECAQAKWAYRHGQRKPVAFPSVTGEPSSEVLARALAPSWCPAGMESACVSYWGNGKGLAWEWFTPTRVCVATFPNSGKKIG